MPRAKHYLGLNVGYDGRDDRYWDEKLGINDQLREALIQKDEESAAHTTVELHSLNFDAEEVKQLAKQDLNFLAGLCAPDIVEYEFPPVLQAIWEFLLQNAAAIFRSPKLAVGIPRGHAKTTLLKLFILYCILYTRIRFILVVCSTEQHAINILADVEDMLNERNVIATYGNWKVGVETNTRTIKKFGFMNRPIILAAIGAGGSLRGLNLKNERPDLMAFDDIQTKECAESMAMSSALERWLIGTAMKARSPRGCLYCFFGNMYPGPNSILRKLRDNPTWVKFVSGAILADGTALWPELRSMDSLIEEFNNDISMGHPEIFLSEVMNDVDVGVNTTTDLGAIKEWPWGPHEIPQGSFIIIDPSNNKKGGDNVAIGRFDVYDATPALVEVIDEKLSPGNTIRRALLLALENKIRLIAVESTAFQYTLLYWFNEIATQLGITGISFVPIYSGSYSKNSRITDMLKKLTQGELVLHSSVRNRVISQIVNWNPLKRDNNDDLLDLLSYSDRVMELYGAEMLSEIEGMVLEAEMGDGVMSFNSAF
jgi:hypothetical protein